MMGQPPPPPPDDWVRLVRRPQDVRSVTITLTPEQAAELRADLLRPGEIVVMTVERARYRPFLSSAAATVTIAVLPCLALLAALWLARWAGFIVIVVTP